MGIILVVLPKIQDAKKIRDLLTSRGFEQVIACNTAAAALGEVNTHDCGLVISGCKLPDMHYTELLDNLPQYYELLLIGSAASISEVDGQIMAITMPIKVYDLVNTVRGMTSQIDQRYKLDKRQRRRDKPRPQRSEREENLIKNAKLLLMDRNHLSEEEAHRYLQKCSMDNGISMVETAQMLLTLIYDET